MGKILIPEGVPAACFEPAPESFGPPATVQPAERSFTVYDLRDHGSCRMIGGPEKCERLERYAFLKRSDGTCALEFQSGWPGGTDHWDGAGSTFELPAEWSCGSFERFLDCLTERYPEEDYGFGAQELAEIPGLREFLGFTE